MEFARDIRRNKEILIRKSTGRTTKNTPHGSTSKFPGARKQLPFSKQSGNVSEERVGTTPSSGATNFYGQQNSSFGSERRETGLSYGATNFYGQQRLARQTC